MQLLQHGAQVDAVDREQRSALRLASWHIQAAACLLLGCDTHTGQACSQGVTALGIAAQETTLRWSGCCWNEEPTLAVLTAITGPLPWLPSVATSPPCACWSIRGPQQCHPTQPLTCLTPPWGPHRPPPLAARWPWPCLWCCHSAAAPWAQQAPMATVALHPMGCPVAPQARTRAAAGGANPQPWLQGDPALRVRVCGPPQPVPGDRGRGLAGGVVVSPPHQQVTLQLLSLLCLHVEVDGGAWKKVPA